MTTYTLTVKLVTDKKVVVGEKLENLIAGASEIDVTGYQIEFPVEAEDLVTDGCGTYWLPCADCGGKMMVLRPGHAICPECYIAP